jgi:hypothetical protein
LEVQLPEVGSDKKKVVRISLLWKQSGPGLFGQDECGWTGTEDALPSGESLYDPST